MASDSLPTIIRIDHKMEDEFHVHHHGHGHSHNHGHGDGHTHGGMMPGALGAKANWQNEVQSNGGEQQEDKWEWNPQKFQWIMGGDDLDSEKSYQAGYEDLSQEKYPRDNVIYLGADFNSPDEVREYSNNIAVLNVPRYGRIQFVKHKPGYIHLSIIVLYWVYGNWSTFRFLLIPHGNEEHMSPIFYWVYCFFSLMTIVSLFRASTLNPGRMPLKGRKEKPPKPGSAPGEQDYCQQCMQYRPWKSHHCRVCGQCVRRMDHHCPWINNCVGEDNHYAFLQLSVYACLMSATVFLMLCLHRWYWPEIQNVELYEDTFAWRHKWGLMVLQTIMAALMASLMGVMAITNHVGIALGMTTIDWKKLEDDIRRVGHFTWDMFPKKRNNVYKQYKAFCGPGSALLWPFPCRRKVPFYQTQGSYV